MREDTKKLEMDIEKINKEIALLRMNIRRTPAEDKKLIALQDERKKYISSKKETTRLHRLYTEKIIERKIKEKEDAKRNLKKLEDVFKSRHEEAGFEEAIDAVIRRECEEIRHWMRICCGRGREESNPVDFLSSVEMRIDSEFLNSRDAIQKQNSKVENIDKNIFMRPIYLEKVEIGLRRRDAPVFLILPVVGERAYACQPADSWSSGKIALPMFWKARGLTIIPALGQFRFQTSKEDAGDDWIVTENFAGEFDNWYSTIKKSSRKREELGLKRGLTVFAFMHLYTKFIQSNAQEFWIPDKDLREIFKKYIPLSK